jgi:hypothetical protein
MKIKSRAGAVGAALALAAALVAVPTAAHAGTIVESGSYSTTYQCQLGQFSLKAQGYKVGPCKFHGSKGLSYWTFWYETK